MSAFSQEDIYLWPDGDWCFAHEFEERCWNSSDDFEVIPVDSDRWVQILNMEHAS